MRRGSKSVVAAAPEQTDAPAVDENISYSV
jgi:hypothetical protein